MATLGTPTYYRAGSSGASTCIGYESDKNRVVRFSFTTGNNGATSISISVTAGTISHQQGADVTTIPFYVGTSSSSHANANKASGSAVTGYIYGSGGKAYSGSANVVLKANTTYYLWFFPNSTTYGWSYWHNNSYYYTDATTSGTSKYSLTISAGTGSTITVNRTYSKVGLSTGDLSNNSTIYNGDKLKITFTPNTNYKLLTHTVNGSTFTSGNTKEVSGANISVASTAQVLASSVGATDANIGSVSTITVTKYNSGYYHTLQYSFEGLSGYITSSGSTQASATRYQTASVPFTIPTSFYAKIPNSKTGTCTITCKTYANSTTSTQLGNSTTVKITVTATGTPTVTGSVVDTNSTTIALTGDASRLIRYKSTAKCTLTATPKNSASISEVKIAGATVTGTNNNGVVTATKSFTNTSSSSFSLYAKDSRGYNQTITASASDMVAYVVLTCNPVLYRTTPTGSEISLDLSGNWYKGSFGAYTNTLTIQYRYKEAGGSYGSWLTIDTTKITKGTSTYRSTNTISLQSYPETDDGGNTVYPGFDYHKDYVVQVRATDGAGGYTLTTATKEVQVNRGIPVFDWGAEDFNFNVPVMLNNVNILNIMYPVGAVYMHGSSTRPAILDSVGTWSSVTTGISGVYAWKRTA